MTTNMINKTLSQRNKLLNDYEYSMNSIILESVPYNYAIGITNICQLHCPLCITGLRKQKKALKYMELELFKEIIEKIKDYALFVQLFRWGEPLLHPNITEMLEYCNYYNLMTEISTNFCLSSIDEKLEAMVRYRLKNLTIAFDGVTQSQYERYRIGGKLATIFENLRKMSFYKYKYNSKHPKITLQFLRNKFTGDQIEVIKSKFKKWGADEYIVYNMSTIFKDRSKKIARNWFSDLDIKNRKYMDVDIPLLRNICGSLYNFMIIEQDGSITPCCFCTDPQDDFEKWDNNKELLELYNSEKYVEARKMFREYSSKNKNIVCHDCSVYLSYWEDQLGC